MADSPPDSFASFDVTTLDDQALAEYRIELYQAILEPGIEFEWFDPDLGEKWYRDRLTLVDEELNSRGLGPVGQGLP
jgi:hypothetical protein